MSPTLGVLSLNRLNNVNFVPLIIKAYTNMATVPLFWYTNMAALTSCEKAL